MINLQKIEMAGVELKIPFIFHIRNNSGISGNISEICYLKVPIPKERIEVSDVTEIAEPASSSV